MTDCNDVLICRRVEVRMKRHLNLMHRLTSLTVEKIGYAALLVQLILLEETVT